MHLAPGPTSLERLQSAIDRMAQKHGFFAIDGEMPEFPAGLAVLLLTDDPQRNLEVLDACVILPEALKTAGAGIARLVAGPAASAALLPRYGVARAPAVVFLRDGQLVGVLNGIRDWSAYQAEVAKLLNGSAPAKPIGIPIRSAG